VSIVPRRRKGPSQFERAADGSMTLMEHLRELRSRLFKGAIAVLFGLIVGLIFAKPVLNFLNQPYCDLHPTQKCAFVFNGPMDFLLLQLRVGLYVGLLLGAPFWLYQLWAFIAPGLHRNERRYTYLFVAIAAPLFIGGAVLAHFVVSKSLHFFLNDDNGQYNFTVGMAGYFDFVTKMMLLFGAGFEFPLIMLMLNFAGVLSARRLLGWWRIAIFLMFVFGAVVTPTPDPFGMSILAGSMALLYFGAVGVAFLNDRRKGRRQPAYAGIGDDEISSLDDYRVEPVEAATPVDRIDPIDRIDPVDAPEPVAKPRPLDRGYDDIT
jgi:sec-independent protein translocase protein TatC